MQNDSLKGLRLARDSGQNSQRIMIKKNEKKYDFNSKKKERNNFKLFDFNRFIK